MKILKADGNRRVYIFEDFTECPYEDKKLFAELKGKNLPRAMDSIPIAELVKPSIEERKEYTEKKYEFLRKKK